MELRSKIELLEITGVSVLYSTTSHYRDYPVGLEAS